MGKGRVPGGQEGKGKDMGFLVGKSQFRSGRWLVGSELGSTFHWVSHGNWHFFGKRGLSPTGNMPIIPSSGLVSLPVSALTSFVSLIKKTLKAKYL